MSTLDLSAYDALCERYLVEGLVRNVLFEDTFGPLGWDADLSAGTLTFSGKGTRSVEVLGTFDPNDGSFLWSWANPGAQGWNPSVLRHARALRERGETEAGLAVFCEPKVADGWVGFRELGLVSTALAERPLAIRDAGGALVLLMVDEEVPLVPPPERWARILMTLPEVYGGALQPCVVEYLRAHGELVEASPGRIRGRFGPSASLDVELDAQGRIARIDGALSKG